MRDAFDTYRKACCGRLPISPPVAAVPQGNILKSYIEQRKTPRRRFKEPALQSGALRPQR